MRTVDWSRLETEEDLIRVAEEAFARLGISGGAFTYTPIGNLPSGMPGLLKRALPINLDPALLEGWFQFQDDIAGKPKSSLSQTFDPVRRYMSQKILPERIVLKEFLDDHTLVRDVVSANWLKKVMQNGIRESFHVPVFSGRGEYWALAALRYDDNPNSEPLSDEALCELHWIGVNFTAICIERLGWRESKMDLVKQPLTQRELECLYWAAQGHSTQETADVLEIQNETVRQYLKTALKKLKARNKAQAIWLAYRLGYLAPP